MIVMKKILIADDHAIFRKGLAAFISETVDMTVAGEAADGAEALCMIRKNDYDLILLDIHMPGRSGLDIIKDIKILKPKLPVLVLSMHPEEQYALRAIQVGAAGYLTKESAPAELEAAIRKVLLGKKYISAALAEALADGVVIGADKPFHERLSNREYMIMCMIAAGKTPKKIAGDLLLSTKTINTYRSRILRKMCMKSNVDLACYAARHNMF